VQRLEGVAKILQVSVRGQVRHRRPEPGHAGNQFAADGAGHRDGAVHVVQDLARSAEKGLAGEGESHPMGGASQELAADESFQGADLPAQRGGDRYSRSAALPKLSSSATAERSGPGRPQD
jgi:hypothetical protein